MINISKSAAEKALGALIREDLLLGYENNGEAIAELKQALSLAISQPMPEAEIDKTGRPMAEIWWDSHNDCAWQLKMLCEPACPEGERIPLYAGDYTTGPIMYINSDGSFTVKPPQN